MTVEFELAGCDFIALNGGPVFEFTPAISFFVTCETEEEVDRYWEELGRGGDPDPEKVARVTEAFLQMEKLEIPALEAAYRG